MIRFRPYPGFTVVTVVMAGFLIGLGVWQMERLQWKLALIAKIQHGLSEKPMSLSDAVDFGSDYTPDLSLIDYRKVVVQGHLLNDKEIYFFATGRDGEPVYHVVTPFVVTHPWQNVRPCGVCAQIIGSNGKLLHGWKPPLDDVLIFIDRGVIPMRLADPAVRRAGQLEGDRRIVGILRNPDSPNWFTPQANIAKRITYTRDPATLSRLFRLPAAFPMFIEADATPNPGGWPLGGQTVIDLPNNHLSYAFTWFGLAAGLAGVYLAYHVSKGRLTWKK